jgi:hypothetical protein
VPPIADPPETTVESPAHYCERTLAGIKSKADHNKTEAMLCFGIGAAATLLVPAFIALGSGLVVGKIIPSALSLVTSFCTGWLQLRRPQLLWGLYRGAQRELEDAQSRYRYRLNDYASTDDPGRVLAERVADIALDLHRKWAPLIPNPENMRLPESSQKTLSVIK